MSNFSQATIWLNQNKKVRCQSWDNPKSYLFKTQWGQIYSHKGSPAYFMSSHFTATDWEIVGEPKCKLCNEYRKLRIDGLCDICSDYLTKRTIRFCEDSLKEVGAL